MSRYSFLGSTIAIGVVFGAATFAGLQMFQGARSLTSNVAAVSSGVSQSSAPSTGGGVVEPMTKAALPQANEGDGAQPPPPPPPPPQDNSGVEGPKFYGTGGQVTAPTHLPSIPNPLLQIRAVRGVVTPPVGRVINAKSFVGLRYLDTGTAVSTLQRCLVTAGTLTTKEVTGKFDKVTRAAVVAVQRMYRSPATGLMDEKTTKLFIEKNVCTQKPTAAATAKPSTVTPKITPTTPVN